MKVAAGLTQVPSLDITLPRPIKHTLNKTILKLENQRTTSTRGSGRSFKDTRLRHHMRTLKPQRSLHLIADMAKVVPLKALRLRGRSRIADLLPLIPWTPATRVDSISLSTVIMRSLSSLRHINSRLSHHRTSRTQPLRFIMVTLKRRRTTMPARPKREQTTHAQLASMIYTTITMRNLLSPHQGSNVRRQTAKRKLKQKCPILTARLLRRHPACTSAYRLLLSTQMSLRRRGLKPLHLPCRLRCHL
jgi:hypothetical protein